MRNRKLNCWEYQGCGLGPLSEDEAPRPVCSAALAEELDGVHGGTNGGRACWAIADTMCEGCEGMTVEEKYATTCRKCALHYRVEIEEGLQLAPVDELRERLARPAQEAV